MMDEEIIERRIVKFERVGDQWRAILGYRDDDPAQPIFEVVNLTSDAGVIVSLLEQQGERITALEALVKKIWEELEEDEEDEG